MKERFKSYLEAQFRTIAPTQSAMDYRKSMLNKMLDKAQEVKAKGITDEDLIFKMVVEEFAGFKAALVQFEEKEEKVKEGKKMKEKFKSYLESEFRAIAPTQSAMEYRKSMLKQMTGRAQELQIKGITDEILIFNMVVEELGDFKTTLIQQEAKEATIQNVKNKISLGTSATICSIVLLTIAFLVTGFATGIWHPTWLIMVGGIFAGIIVAGGFALPKLIEKKKILVVRGIVAVCVTLITVFVFLLLQVGVDGISGAWQAFIVLPVALLGFDTLIAFITNSKTKNFQLPVFVEVFFVMLYVLLGLNVDSFWHPGWLLSLVGVVFAIGQACIVLYKKNNDSDKVKNSKTKLTDEDYYTNWD